MQKKASAVIFFSCFVKKSLPQLYLVNSPFLHNPDVAGGVTSSSQLQWNPPSSYKVPMESDRMIKTATEENAKLDLDRLIVHISNHLEFRVRGFLLHFNHTV